MSFFLFRLKMNEQGVFSVKILGSNPARLFKNKQGWLQGLNFNDCCVNIRFNSSFIYSTTVVDNLLINAMFS